MFTFTAKLREFEAMPRAEREGFMSAVNEEIAYLLPVHRRGEGTVMDKAALHQDLAYWFFNEVLEGRKSLGIPVDNHAMAQGFARDVIAGRAYF